MRYQSNNKKGFEQAPSQQPTTTYVCIGVMLHRYVSRLVLNAINKRSLFFRFTRKVITKRQYRSTLTASNWNPECALERALAHAGIRPATPNRIPVSVTTALLAGPGSGTFFRRAFQCYSSFCFVLSHRSADRNSIGTILQVLGPVSYYGNRWNIIDLVSCLFFKSRRGNSDCLFTYR